MSEPALAAEVAVGVAGPSGPTQADRAAESLAFAREVAKLARADKCTDVIVLDVSGLSPVTDYLVIATGSSGRQMRSTADDLIELGEKSGFAPLSASGLDSDTWVCVDFVDVLLHIFSADARQYYDLESLWGDATKVPLDG